MAYAQSASANSRIDAATTELLATIGAAIARDAQRYAPVDTGELRGSIEAEAPIGNTVRIVARADYAAHVELGTSRMAAQPYLRPALYQRRAG